MQLSGFCLWVILCAAGAQGAEFQIDDRGFIHDWLIGGPFPSYWVRGQAQGFSDDFLDALGGEAQAEPYEGLRAEAEFIADQAKLIAGIGSTNEWGYTQSKRFAVAWKPLRSEEAIVRLNEAFPPLKQHVAAYALCYVESPQRQRIKVRLGSADDHKLFLNGVQIGAAQSSQPVTPDKFIYEATLQRGLNRLLLKVVRRTGDFGFCLALSDAQNAPLRDVAIRLEHPRHKLMAQNRALRGVDAWDRGFFAAVQGSGKGFFAGRNTIRVQAGTTVPGTYALELKVEAAGRTLATKERKAAPLAPGQLVEWNLDLDLPAGAGAVMLRAWSGDTEVAQLVRPIEVQDAAALKAQTREILEKIAGQEKALAAAKAEAAALATEARALEERRAGLYAAIEADYAAHRAKLVSDPPPVDEPLAPADVVRCRTCLNGDQWWIGAGESSEDKDRGYTPPEPGSMTPGVLPMLGLNSYFRTRCYPVALADAKNPYGKLKPSPGWEDYEFNPLICAKKLWFRTQVELDAASATGACTLVGDDVNGSLKAYLNGRFCGGYSGNIGPVTIALEGAKPGANVLELFFEAPPAAFPPPFSQTWGIVGDVSLETTSRVHVAAATVTTSWRKATLSTVTEVENRSSVPALVRLQQYCVLNGRVKYRLPPRQAQVAAGATVALENSGLWREAQPWGIGGEYGPPILYDLMSDLYLDDKLIDRHVTPFGFREFWIAGCDFYLNGRRIILQGNVGFESRTAGLANRRSCEVIFPLLRTDGVNIIRSHDSDYHAPAFLRLCDQLGMLAYAQMYPVLHEKKPLGNLTSGRQDYLSYDEWLRHPLHQRNLENYARWVKMLRNHPSVVVASTDNEIFTQAWDTLEKRDFNLRNDRLGAFYEKYVKSLDPTLVMTRDGDEGTWGHKGQWQEEPPCETANYHYPDFHISQFVNDWQTVYDFRPALFGETLYYSYGAWDNWIGALPSQVHKKALRVREVASLYRHLGVPGQIYMGPLLDGFVCFDESGRGNPWQITASMHDACLAKGTPIAALPGYPWAQVPWPSLSGPGLKLPATRIDVKRSGIHAINWFDPAVPTHVRNEVNDAYRDSLLPQPPLAPPQDAECLVELGPGGNGQTVRAQCLAPPGEQLAAVADQAGTAWLHLPRPGRYRIECRGQSTVAEIAGRAGYSAQPGFQKIPRVRIERKQGVEP